MSTRSDRTAIACAIISCLWLLPRQGLAGDLVATPIPPECRVEQRTGLTVSFFDFHPKQGPGIESLNDATRFVTTQKPVFTMPLPGGVIDFPRGESRGVKSVEPLGQFFFGHATESNALPRSARAGRVTQSAGDRCIMVFRGALTVDAAGVLPLSVSVDDAVDVRIGGIAVYQREPLGDMLPPGDARSRFYVEFFEAGVYPVRVTFAQCEGYMGVRLMRHSAVNATNPPAWHPLRVAQPGS